MTEIQRFIRYLLKKNGTMTYDKLAKECIDFCSYYYGEKNAERKFLSSLDGLIECGIVDVVETPMGKLYRLNPNPPKVKVRICKYCRRPFEVRYPTHRFCSRNCCKRFYALVDVLNSI